MSVQAKKEARKEGRRVKRYGVINLGPALSIGCWGEWGMGWGMGEELDPGPGFILEDPDLSDCPILDDWTTVGGI